MQEQVGRRLALGDLAGAEDAALEALVQAGEPQRVPEHLVAAAGGHAGGRGDAVQRLDDAVDRGELGVERRPVAAVEPVLPVSRQAVAQPVQDLLGHEGLRAAHEPLDHLGLAQRPAELGEDGGLHANREALAVDQDAVAVEDDELQRLGHARQCTGAIGWETDR